MTIENSFGTLVNDITKQVLVQVQQQVLESINAAVAQRIDDLVSTDVINELVSREVTQRIISFQPDMSAFEQRIIDAGNTIINTINSDSTRHINELISNQIRGVNIEELTKLCITNNLNARGQHLSLIDNIIPGTAINTESLKITGDNVQGGTITDFASTGIDDRASTCQVTILDAGTVFENKLYAKAVEVKGDAVIDGNLIINGSILKDSPGYQKIIADVTDIADATYNRVFDRMQNESFDIAKLTIGQRSIIEGSTLTNAVTSSQLQRVGVLRDLQTDGETFLSETLYTTNRRVGVNTMDPATALSVWDEEIEIGIGKQSKDTAQINSRAVNFIISVANKKNITLTEDGTTIIPRLQLGNMTMSSGSVPPSYNAAKGSVVFNENPSLGGPMGWISLGDARWANFGIID